MKSLYISGAVQQLKASSPQDHETQSKNQELNMRKLNPSDPKSIWKFPLAFIKLESSSAD